jgi:hypothetical protein
MCATQPVNVSQPAENPSKGLVVKATQRPLSGSRGGYFFSPLDFSTNAEPAEEAAPRLFESPSLLPPSLLPPSFSAFFCAFRVFRVFRRLITKGE